MPKANVDCPEGDQLVCMNDKGKLWPNETAEMCPDCQLRCTEKPKEERNNTFCNPAFTPVSMYMTGLHFGPDKNAPCLVYLFHNVVLNTQWKMALACVLTAFLAVFTECTCVVRQKIRGKIDNQPMTAPGFPKLVFEAMVVGAYSMQAFLSYALMLVAMTYKGELLISVVVGLTVAHVLVRLKYSSTSSSDSPELCCRLNSLEVPFAGRKRSASAGSEFSEGGTARSRANSDVPLLDVSTPREKEGDCSGCKK
mmetsp:Transcript_14181/g.35871  ORF Transcript_14181/g.35871 Transcript_14181/m.35871 type:complete len:253 (+) Transcript_14181:1-759(+)